MHARTPNKLHTCKHKTTAHIQNKTAHKHQTNYTHLHKTKAHAHTQNKCTRTHQTNYIHIKKFTHAHIHKTNALPNNTNKLYTGSRTKKQNCTHIKQNCTHRRTHTHAQNKCIRTTKLKLLFIHSYAKQMYAHTPNKLHTHVHTPNKLHTQTKLYTHAHQTQSTQQAAPAPRIHTTAHKINNIRHLASFTLFVLFHFT